MFGGNNGMTTYDGATGKFAETNSTNWTPFDYLNETAFKQKADLSMAGATQDCGECHVGGGANEYVPWSAAQMAARTSLRNITSANVNGAGTIDPTEFTTFNYLIDTYDVDGDGDKAEALYVDYTKTGVAEMDCMMCHLEGYSWDDRTEQIRKLKHDAARAVGAGMATPNAMAPAAYGSVGWGTSVGAYDAAKVVDNGAGVLKLATTFAAQIKKQPPSANCSSCHFGNGVTLGATVGADGKPARRMVDFKKRGDHWADNTNWDIHSAALECMDCHANSGTALYVNDVQPAGAAGVDATTGTSGAAYGTGADVVNNTTGAAGADGFVDASGVPVEMTGAGPGLQGMCDPKKGFGNFESVWNAKDAGSNLTCTKCHYAGTTYPGATDPAAAHAAKGLTATTVQNKTSTGGVANASHLDIIECNTCHIRKLDHYTGGGIVDATGKDHEGRLADHENQYIEMDMYDNLIHVWYNGKLTKAHNNLTMFWTDKNDQRDANNDTRAFGLDPLLMSHVEQINSANGWASLSEDKHGNIAPADIDTRQTAFTAALDAKLLDAAQIPHSQPIIPKISIMGVPFNVDHGTSRKSETWGSGGCADCHAPGSNFFSGAKSMKPTGMTAMSWNAGDVVPYTKVNSGKDLSSYHPAMTNKKENRTLPINLAGVTSLGTVDRSKFMYEETFRKPNTAWSADGGVITGAAIASTVFSSTYNPTTGVAGTTKGLFMHVEVADVGDTVADQRITLQCGGEVANVAALLAAMDSGTRANGRLASGAYGFTVTAGADNLILTANAGKVIRVVPGTQQADDGAILGFDNALYVVDPIVGVKGGSFAGRADYVAYLEGLASPGAAVITAPALAPPALNAAVAGTDVTFTANTTGHVATTTLYKWDMGNGMVYETEKDANGQPLTPASYKHNNGTPSNTADDVTGIVGSLATVSYAYPVTGQFTAQLFVMNSNGGGQNSDSAIVAVGSPVATPTWTATWDANGTPALLTDDQMELAGLPADWTKIYVVWDDGTKTNVTTGAGSATANILHAYRLIAQRQVGGTHVFNPTIRVYNGTTLLGTRKVTVTTTP